VSEADLAAARESFASLTKQHNELTTCHGEANAELKVKTARISDLDSEVEQQKLLLDAKAAGAQSLQDRLSDTTSRLKVSGRRLNPDSLTAKPNIPLERPENQLSADD
jgi:chromosome segregation ATPase